jgi:hypothetical protein
MLNRHRPLVIALLALPILQTVQIPIAVAQVAHLPEIEQVPRPVVLPDFHDQPHFDNSEFRRVTRHLKGVLKHGGSCGTDTRATISRLSYAASSDAFLPGLSLITSGSFAPQQVAVGPVDPATGAFDVSWTEGASSNTLPWGVVTGGSPRIVYSFLSIYFAAPDGGGGVLVGTPAPVPLVQFLGLETERTLGTVTLTCEAIQ